MPTYSVAGIGEAFIPSCECRLHELSDLERDTSRPITLLVSHDDRYKGSQLEQGLDTLGEYDPGENNITLFDRAIAAFARKSGIDEGFVAEIVMVHEIAHSVTHRGRFNGNDWKSFTDKTKFWQKGGPEHYAQLATWIYLKSDRPELVDSFKTMSEKCPEEYQTWKESVGGRDLEEVQTDYRDKLRKDSGRHIHKGQIADEITE